MSDQTEVTQGVAEMAKRPFVYGVDPIPGVDDGTWDVVNETPQSLTIKVSVKGASRYFTIKVTEHQW